MYMSCTTCTTTKLWQVLSERIRLRPSSLMSVNDRNKVMMRGLHRLRGKRVARTYNVQFMATNVLYITELHSTHGQKYSHILTVYNVDKSTTKV